MKPLEQLINHDEPGILLVRQWAESASNALEFLWTKQGSTENSHRGIVPVASEFQLRLELISQLSR